MVLLHLGLPTDGRHARLWPSKKTTTCRRRQRGTPILSLCLPAVSGTSDLQSMQGNATDILSGVRLLNMADPVYIEDNGKVTSSRPRKRDVPLEVRYKQTPAAFEGFMTRIKAEHAGATVGAMGLAGAFGAGK